MSSETLKALFEPESVAVLGASASQGKVGYFLFRNILEGGFGGRLYAVNPNARRVLGRPSYRSILGLPERPDLAFLAVPNRLVKPALIECAEKKVKAAVIVAAGFSEIGRDGAKVEQELRKIIRAGGLRAVGPNSVGLVNAGHKLVASFVPFRPWPEGPIAIGAQTGIFAGAYADQMSQQQSQRTGFSLSLCFGNKIDIDETDFLEYAARDTRTKVVALHLESLHRPREFLAAASRVKREKPLIVLKTGRTEQGARAAASHTGSLAASDRIVDAAFRQYGLIRAENLEELQGIAKALAWQPLPRGRRVAVVTFSGALGVMALDAMRNTRLELAQFSACTVRAIARLMPPWQPVQNPADVWMALGGNARKAHQEILGAVLADPQVDLLLAILLPIENTDFVGLDRLFRSLRHVHPAKPVFSVMVGGRVKQRWLQEIEPAHIPNYSEPGAAIRAMDAMCFYAETRLRPCPDPCRLRRRSCE